MPKIIVDNVEVAVPFLKWWAKIIASVAVGFIIGYTTWVTVGVNKAYSHEDALSKISNRNCEKDKEWERYQQERVLNYYYWTQVGIKLGIPPPPQVDKK